MKTILNITLALVMITCLSVSSYAQKSDKKVATVEIKKGKTLEDALNKIAKKSGAGSFVAITELSVMGTLSDNDFKLLRTLTTTGKGALKHLDLTNVENKTIKNAQFADCTNLEFIALPKGLATVPRELCRRCSNLKQVVVNEGTKIIGRHAFGNTAITEVWFPSTIEYVYGYVFDNVNMENFQALHLKSLPFQWLNVARSDASEGENQEKSWSMIFPTNLLPATVFVPAEYVEYYKYPDPQHVVCGPLKDILKKMNAEDADWVEGPTENAPYLRAGNPLKRSFRWMRGTTEILPEPIK